ncbi:hypothetical protein J6590_072524 [Homalodisca vitripennis]|nr:hypothetical protein J6590_072524 [Homalodisca vitripennis]
MKAQVIDLGSWNSVGLLHSIDDCRYGGQPEENCFFYFSILASDGLTKLGPDNFYFPVPLHSINGPSRPNIQVCTSWPERSSTTCVDNIDHVRSFVLTDRLNTIQMIADELNLGKIPS